MLLFCCPCRTIQPSLLCLPSQHLLLEICIMSALFWDASGPLAYLSFPGSAFLVNAISWISVSTSLYPSLFHLRLVSDPREQLALGLFFSLPFALFVAYDILLWIWRTYQNHSIQPQNAQIPATAGTMSTNTTAISPEHHDQRARRR
ncbi:hypothetical protein ACQKWADRAFT_23001 [Trichoderma austrokoningii]